MRTTIVPLQTIAATGPTASVDVSGIQGDFSLTIRVTALSSVSGQTGARIVIEESVNSFATALPVIVWDVTGPVVAGDVKIARRAYEIPLSKIGQAGSLLRANVVYLQGTSPSLKFEVWLDQ